MTWIVCVTLLTTLLVWKWRVDGPSVAMGVAFLYSLLIPTWISIELFGLPINVRTAVASIGLVAYCFHPKAVFQTKLSVPDYAVIAIFCVQVLSDTINDGFSLKVPALAYGEWIIPYLVGRTAFQSSSDVRRTRVHACVVATIFAIWAATESIGHVNPANFVFGQRPLDRTPIYMERWWLKRAEGPTIHAIWFGMVQALLLPWTLSAATGVFNRLNSWWGLAAPFVSFVGIFFSLSRGPIAQSLLTACFVPLFFLSNRLRAGAIAIAFVIASIVYSGFGLAGFQYLVDSRKNNSMRIVDGEVFEYNGTTHRVLILSVYREAMIKAGLIGFGTESTNTFPVRVPVSVADPKTMSTAWSIDNHFIILQLRLGALGVIAVLTILVSAAILALRRAARSRADVAVFSMALGGSLLCIPLIFMAEWMPHDYGFVVICLAGCASGISSPNEGPRTGSELIPQ